MSPAKKPARKPTGSSKSAGASRTPKPAARKPVAKPAAKKTAAKKTAAKKTTAKKTTAKKTTAKKTTAKKTAAKKTTAKKTVAKKAPAKKATARKPAPARKAVAKKAPAKKVTAKKTAAKKPAAKKPEAKKTSAAPRAGAAPRKKTAAPRTAARPQPTRTGAPAARPPRPANFDKKQLSAIRERLLEERAELVRQQNELDAEGTQGESMAEAGLDDDFADAGTATFDRERDLSIRNNITDLIDQITRAVSRIDEGSYGTCERCGRPIDAARLKALPHALLCLDCKRREERGR